MSTKIQDIGWGKYLSYEGPVHYGRDAKLTKPAGSSENDILVYILSQTEGGSVSAVNMYDRCIVSVGLFQWCEAAYHLTSNLLGAIAAKNPELLDPLAPALAASNAEFKRNTSGKWRFFFKDGRGEVDTAAEQQQLFLLNSSGLLGTWDDVSKAHAKLWAACLANVLVQPEAIEVQVDFTAGRVKSFATPFAKSVLFDDGLPSTGWTGAMRAIYLSYAGNLPAVADKHLRIALATAPGQKWSKDWCLHIMKELAFGPQIAIFPGRYEKVRPLVEKLYGVDLPDFAKDLKAWRSAMGDEPKSGEPSFESVEDIQEVLLKLGFDLGPKGADGKMGSKTRDALITFQKQNALVPDGLVGPKTKAKLLEAWKRA